MNLLRWLPGYEASQLNFKGELPMGFALFSNHQCAIGAKDAIQVSFHDTLLEIFFAAENVFLHDSLLGWL